MNTTTLRKTRLAAVAFTSTALVFGVVAAPTLATQASASVVQQGAQNQVPSRTVPVSEQQTVEGLNFKKIAENAKPAKVPAQTATPASAPITGADGPAVEVNGVLPKATTPGPVITEPSTTPSAVGATDVTNGALWPGSATSNPNAQVGKLYFDINPSATVQDWRHCTGTAINSQNKSTVLTAGHCVYDFANKRWYTNLWFYPGYQNGGTLGAWSVRTMSTTNNYYNKGLFADDMAVVLVNRDSAGYTLVNRVGGQGIAFNQPVNVFRSSFGYPITDSRWPGYTADGEDLRYCQGTDTYYSSGTFAGQMLLSCKMTGGASGGPWLSGVNSSWLGTATSVNSNKGGTGATWTPYMFGPYMGAQESAVFQTYRAA